jgi:hypothetical protein
MTGPTFHTDIQGPTDWSAFPPATSHICATPPRITSLYALQQQVPAYRALVQQNVTIFGTIDGTKAPKAQNACCA